MLYKAQVKGVHGLAVFEHDIVGDVYNVVDGAHAHHAQALPHPAGRGLHPHIFDNARAVGRAKVRRLDRDVQKLLSAAVATLYNRGVQSQRLLEGGSHFARQTDHRKAVGAVRSDLKLHLGIVKANRLLNRVAGLAVLLQHENSVFNRIGEVVQRQAQLAQGAHHAKALYAAQLAFFDFHAVRQGRAVQRRGNQIVFLQVLCAGHDLNRLGFTDINRADQQVIRIGVRCNRQHAADDDLVNVGSLCVVFFYFRAGNRNCLREITHGHRVQRNKFL